MRYDLLITVVYCPLYPLLSTFSQSNVLSGDRIVTYCCAQSFPSQDIQVHR